ncbi:MAG: sodium:solute symporter family transporter [Planctomycetota bacterium]|jgi:SSS family transporter
MPEPTLAAPAAFHILDWMVLAGYLLVVVLVGLHVGSRQRSSDDFFLGGHAMPLWAVAVSVLATSLSAATFLGGPEKAFAGDLTYLLGAGAALLAAVVTAVLFIPRFYRLEVTSIYELLGHEFGLPARQAASAMFLLGRVFASGARLFIVAIPFAWIAFGEEPTRAQLVTTIVVIALAATVYTSFGGIRAVIWTDVLQAVLVVGAVGGAAWVLLGRIPLPPAEIVEALRADGEDGGKLRWLSLSTDPDETFTLWTVLTGLLLLNLAAYGTDQDLTQRMLTCRTARAGSWSVIVANLVGLPVVFLFLALGLLLYVYYGRPDLMGDAAPAYAIGRDRAVFVEFILRELPAGLRGVLVAGLFAAAMSSLDSALNAMASTTIADFYRPWRVRREGFTLFGRRRELGAARAMVAWWGVVLGAFACLCVWWQEASDLPLIDFALMVMTFAYSGLLAVFLTALLTPRGNAFSAAAALVVGFVTIAAFQPDLWRLLAPPFVLEQVLDDAGEDLRFQVAFPWRMTIATALSFVVCCLGARRSGSSLQA